MRSQMDAPSRRTLSSADTSGQVACTGRHAQPLCREKRTQRTGAPSPVYRARDIVTPVQRAWTPAQQLQTVGAVAQIVKKQSQMAQSFEAEDLLVPEGA
jgi:hypothetical protein